MDADDRANRDSLRECSESGAKALSEIVRGWHYRSGGARKRHSGDIPAQSSGRSLPNVTFSPASAINVPPVGRADPAFAPAAPGTRIAISLQPLRGLRDNRQRRPDAPALI